LAEVIGMAVATGPGEAASIMMRTGNTVESVAYSCELIRRADAVQYELGEGPVPGRGVTGGVHGLGSARGRPVAPVAPAAAELGVRSSLSVHLLTDTALGSLNLYSLQPRDYDPAEVETAKIIAAQASAVLAYTRNEHRFWQAIDTRNLIGHAQGMLTQNTGSLRCVRDTVCRRFVSCWGTFAGQRHLFFLQAFVVCGLLTSDPSYTAPFTAAKVPWLSRWYTTTSCLRMPSSRSATAAGRACLHTKRATRPANFSPIGAAGTRLGSRRRVGRLTGALLTDG
jgi:hypothetical protein